ncbi:MAG: hypothetical protein PHT42_07035 [Thermotogota bacterium]|nr:hypothetical protein [Thermotogota bacterium]
MFTMPETITYSLPEQIGDYGLFVGRKKEFDYFLGDWYYYLRNNMAQSQAIVARRKKGKTAFLQRLFNTLWSAPESGIIPFYYSIKDMDMTLAEFSKSFFATFANHYISYARRNPEYIQIPHTFESLEEVIEIAPELGRPYQSIQDSKKEGEWGLMWEVASRAPFEISVSKGVKIVQIFDEFQNINAYVCDQRGEKIGTMSGTYLDLAEKKEAPLIISGSEVHGLIKIIRHLTGRFAEYALGNLPEDEAKEAIRRYANAARTAMNEPSVEKIWNLTQGDPLYIKALFTTRYNDTKDYTNEENIIATYTEEITRGEIYKTWIEYLAKVFYEVNEKNAKRLMLYLFHAGEERTRAQMIQDLKLDMTDFELEKKLYQLIKADLISQGETNFDYIISKDITYELVFRRIYQKEIDNFVPDIRDEIRKEMGKTNYEKGKFREYLVRERLKKPFNLKEIAENGIDLIIKPKAILEREKVKVGLQEREIDLIVKGNVELWIDVKDTKGKYGKREAERWIEIKRTIGEEKPKTLFAVYSQNGYTATALEQLKSNEIYVIELKEKG